MKGQKIYIVEDDSIIKMLLGDLITSMGHEVSGSASSAQEALHDLPACPTDLIILDIGLNGNTDGIQLANSINRDFAIPFIYVTGNSDNNTIVRAKATKPLGFIFKPFDETIFTERINEFIAQL